MAIITDDKLRNCRFNLTVIFITIRFRSTQLVCCTHQIKLPNANLHYYTGLRHTCNHLKYDTYSTIHPRECFYKTPESWEL